MQVMFFDFGIYSTVTDTRSSNGSGIDVMYFKTGDEVSFTFDLVYVWVETLSLSTPPSPSRECDLSSSRAIVYCIQPGVSRPRTESFHMGFDI